MTTRVETTAPPEPGADVRLWPLLGLSVLALYAFATIAPSGATWGIHALGYFSPWVRILGLACCAALLFPPFQEPVVQSLDVVCRPILRATSRSSLLALVLAATAFAAFYAFSIRTDIYGDARTILHWDADLTRRFEDGWFARVFSLELLGDKEALTLLLHRSFSQLFSVPIGQAYRIISSLSGALYLLLWVWFVRRCFASSRWAPMLLVTGLLMGCNQIFFGHVETYPLAALASMSFLLVGSLALERGRYIWAALVVLFVAIRVHPALVYFIPVMIFVVVHALARRFPVPGPMQQWKPLVAILVLPSLLLGAALYAFYFKSFNEPHAGLGREFAHAFLPIIPGDPPLDRYSMQSFNHLIDFGNVLLLVGTPVIVSLLGVVLFHHRAIAWRSPRVMYAVLAAGYPLLFFFVVNPALSMPRDWDLYALFGAPSLFLLAALIAGSSEPVRTGPVLGTTLGLGVFTIAFCALNASPDKLSARLEHVGEHVFKTYHAGSSYIINVAQGMEPDTATSLARRIATLERLAPHRTGEDGEYTHLITKVADLYIDRGDLQPAVAWMERAVAVAPHDDNLALWLSDYYLQARRTADARRQIAVILGRDPRNLQALLLGAVASAQVEDFSLALTYLERAKALAPTDPDIAEWIATARRNAAEQKRPRPTHVARVDPD